MTRLLALTIIAVSAAIAGCGVGDASDAPEASGPAAPVWFDDVTSRSGLDFIHRADFTGKFAIAEIMGSGLAVFDANGDGRLDIYILDAGDALGEGAPNRLFLQRADGTFEDATATSGLGDDGFGMGAAVGDVDNDGDLDVYVGNVGPDALYLNDGTGVFTDATASAGIAGDMLTTSVAMVDYDADGFLDIYVLHYLEEDAEKKCFVGGRRDYCGPQTFPAQPDTLYRNRGDGTFEDVSRKAGIGKALGHGLGIVIAHLDDDADIDLYVANDNDANFFWSNQGDGTFTEMGMMVGLALNNLGESESSMGLAIGDVNGDGLDDILSTHLGGQTNTLYCATPEGMWEDRTGRSGLAKASLGFTGFGCQFADFDNDGDLDIAVGNGKVARDENGIGTQEAFQRDYSEVNQILVNDAGHFEEVERGGGLGDACEITRGLAVVDIDGDGGLDVVLTNNNGPARIHRNVIPDRGHWLGLRAIDPALKRDVYGARIVVRSGERIWRRTVSPARSYLTSAASEVHVGLGDLDQVDAIEVIWLDGSSETFACDSVDRRLELRRGEGLK